MVRQQEDVASTRNNSQSRFDTTGAGTPPLLHQSSPSFLLVDTATATHHHHHHTPPHIAHQQIVDHGTAGVEVMHVYVGHQVTIANPADTTGDHDGGGNGIDGVASDVATTPATVGGTTTTATARTTKGKTPTTNTTRTTTTTDTTTTGRRRTRRQADIPQCWNTDPGTPCPACPGGCSVSSHSGTLTVPYSPYGDSSSVWNQYNTTPVPVPDPVPAAAHSTAAIDPFVVGSSGDCGVSGVEVNGDHFNPAAVGQPLMHNVATHHHHQHHPGGGVGGDVVVGDSVNQNQFDSAFSVASVGGFPQQQQHCQQQHEAQLLDQHQHQHQHQAQPQQHFWSAGPTHSADDAALSMSMPMQQEPVLVLYGLVTSPSAVPVATPGYPNSQQEGLMPFQQQQQQQAYEGMAHHHHPDGHYLPNSMMVAIPNLYSGYPSIETRQQQGGNSFGTYAHDGHHPYHPMGTAETNLMMIMMSMDMDMDMGAEMERQRGIGMEMEMEMEREIERERKMEMEMETGMDMEVEMEMGMEMEMEIETGDFSGSSQKQQHHNPINNNTREMIIVPGKQQQHHRQGQGPPNYVMPIPRSSGASDTIGVGVGVDSPSCQSSSASRSVAVSPSMNLDFMNMNIVSQTSPMPSSMPTYDDGQHDQRGQQEYDHRAMAVALALGPRPDGMQLNMEKIKNTRQQKEEARRPKAKSPDDDDDDDDDKDPQNERRHETRKNERKTRSGRASGLRLHVDGGSMEVDGESRGMDGEPDDGAGQEDEEQQEEEEEEEEEKGDVDGEEEGSKGAEENEQGKEQGGEEEGEESRKRQKAGNILSRKRVDRDHSSMIQVPMVDGVGVGVRGRAAGVSIGVVDGSPPPRTALQSSLSSTTQLHLTPSSSPPSRPGACPTQYVFQSYLTPPLPSSSPPSASFSSFLAAARHHQLPNRDQRNRAAATRYRTKSKAAQATLELSVQELSSRRQQLLLTLKVLEQEKYELKTAMLQHATCDCHSIREYMKGEAMRILMRGQEGGSSAGSGQRKVEGGVGVMEVKSMKTGVVDSDGIGAGAGAGSGGGMRDR